MDGVDIVVEDQQTNMDCLNAFAECRHFTANLRVLPLYFTLVRRIPPLRYSSLLNGYLADHRASE